MFSDDQLPASFQNFGDVVGVHCACVEVFTRMVLVPVFVSLSQEFLQSELPSYDFLHTQKKKVTFNVQLQVFGFGFRLSPVL